MKRLETYFNSKKNIDSWKNWSDKMVSGLEQLYAEYEDIEDDPDLSSVEKFNALEPLHDSIEYLKMVIRTYEIMSKRRFNP